MWGATNGKEQYPDIAVYDANTANEAWAIAFSQEHSELDILRPRPEVWLLKTEGSLKQLQAILKSAGVRSTIAVFPIQHSAVFSVPAG